MTLHWKRNGFSLRFQIVCAISSRALELSSDEQSIVKDMFRKKATDKSSRVIRVNVSPRWVEVVLDVDPGVDPTKFLRFAKSESSYELNRLSPGRAEEKLLWAPGYVVTTVGQFVDAADTAAELDGRTTPREEKTA